MPNQKEQKKRHPDYGLQDQARGRCPYCLASAEMDCDCEKTNKKEQQDWEKRNTTILEEQIIERLKISFVAKSKKR